MTAYEWEVEEARSAREADEQAGLLPDLIKHRGAWYPADDAEELLREQRNEDRCRR